MSTKTRIAAVLIAFSTTACGIAAAADNGYYIGGSLGQARPNFDTAGSANNANTTINSSDGIYKVFAGYQFHKYFSFEATYINLGSYNVSNGNTIEPAGWGIALVGTLPIANNVSLLGRIGEYRMRQKMNPIAIDDNSWSPSFGAGLKYDFNPNLSARAEYERIQKIGTNSATISEDANVYSVGLGYKF